MKTYRGEVVDDKKIVTVDDLPLRGLYPANARRNVPFDWGRRSRGAKHLAEALLTDCAGSSAANFYAPIFADTWVAQLPKEWTFKSEVIEKWLDQRDSVGHSAQQARLRSPSTGNSPLLMNDLPRFPDVLDEVRASIEPDELAKQGFPRPKEVRLSRDTDSTGEDAYYVYLVFPDRTPESALAWEKVEPMVSWVRNLVWTRTGAQLWPYVKVKRQKQMAGGRV